MSTLGSFLGYDRSVCNRNQNRSEIKSTTISSSDSRAEWLGGCLNDVNAIGI